MNICPSSSRAAFDHSTAGLAGRRAPRRAEGTAGGDAERPAAEGALVLGHRTRRILEHAAGELRPHLSNAGLIALVYLWEDRE